MPDVDGFAVLEWMAEKKSSVPVIVLTSSENEEHEERSLALGAREFYRKPPDLDELGDVVRSIVEAWVESADSPVSESIPSAG